jgi:hypothetical protein
MRVCVCVRVLPEGACGHAIIISSTVIDSKTCKKPVAYSGRRGSSSTLENDSQNPPRCVLKLSSSPRPPFHKPCSGRKTEDSQSQIEHRERRDILWAVQYRISLARTHTRQKRAKKTLSRYYSRVRAALFMWRGASLLRSSTFILGSSSGGCFVRRHWWLFLAPNPPPVKPCQPPTHVGRRIPNMSVTLFTSPA